MSLGIFGGTFNPIHLGHLRIAEEVFEMLGLEGVVFVPSGNPPLKSKDILDAKERYNLVRRAISGNKHFQISDIEIKSRNRSYTIDTIEKMLKIYSHKKLYLIVGLDAFTDLHLWHKPERLIRLVDFVIPLRYGFPLKLLLKNKFIKSDSIKLTKKLRNDSIQLPLIGGKKAYILNTTTLDISATMIRQRVKEGKSIKYLVPDSILYNVIEKYR